MMTKGHSIAALRLYGRTRSQRGAGSCDKLRMLHGFGVCWAQAWPTISRSTKLLRLLPQRQHGDGESHGGGGPGGGRGSVLVPAVRRRHGSPGWRRQRRGVAIARPRAADRRCIAQPALGPGDHSHGRRANSQHASGYVCVRVASSLRIAWLVPRKGLTRGQAASEQ